MIAENSPLPELPGTPLLFSHWTRDANSATLEAMPTLHASYSYYCCSTFILLYYCCHPVQRKTPQEINAAVYVYVRTGKYIYFICCCTYMIGHLFSTTVSCTGILLAGDHLPTMSSVATCMRFALHTPQPGRSWVTLGVAVLTDT